MTIQALQIAIERHIDHFLEAPLVRQADIGEITMADYHDILARLFHQVASSSCTFAIAGGNLGLDRIVARDYLMHHAEEEKSHWQWILNDLAATGYNGPDLRQQFPGVETAAYLAFNYYVAQRMPLARLGIAAMLESIGARLGKTYALKVITALGLTPNEMSFFLGHGDTDIGHTEEIFDILQRSHLNEREWRDVIWAAEVAATLYQRLYTAP